MDNIDILTNHIQRDDRVDPYGTFPIHARPRPKTDVFSDAVKHTQLASTIVVPALKID